MRTGPTTGRARARPRRDVLRVAATATAAGVVACLLPRPAGAAAACGGVPWGGVVVPGDVDAVAEGAADPGADRSLGVFPYLPPLSLDRVFAPIVDDLRRALGRTVRLRTKPSFEAFGVALADGAYDLALVHPFLYVAAAAHGYLPIVRVDEPLRLVFLARDEAGGVGSLGDLAGGQILALPPALAAVSVMAEAALAGVGLRPGTDVRLRHLASKMSCVQAVASGAAAACGLPDFAVTQLEAEAGRPLPLRAFHETSMPVSLAVVGHGHRLPGPERERVRDLMVGWSGTVEGRAILVGAGWPGFVPALDGDYDVARAVLARGGASSGTQATPAAASRPSR